MVLTVTVTVRTSFCTTARLIFPGAQLMSPGLASAAAAAAADAAAAVAAAAAAAPAAAPPHKLH